MKIWVFVERGDDGFWCSTHLTEKGCLLMAVDIVLDVLGVTYDTQEDFDKWKEEATRSHYQEEVGDLPCVVNWRDRTLKELWEIYDSWSALTWCLATFDCQIEGTTVSA